MRKPKVYKIRATYFSDNTMSLTVDWDAMAGERSELYELTDIIEKYLEEKGYKAGEPRR